MAGCYLYDTGCDYLMDGLERNVTLFELDLSSNSIRAHGAKRIAEVLTNPGLKLTTLILKGNFFGELGGNYLARALPFNKRLTKLDLFDTQLKDECVK